jgi:hypothetical protein
MKKERRLFRNIRAAAVSYAQQARDWGAARRKNRAETF